MPPPRTRCSITESPSVTPEPQRDSVSFVKVRELHAQGIGGLTCTLLPIFCEIIHLRPSRKAQLDSIQVLPGISVSCHGKHFRDGIIRS